MANMKNDFRKKALKDIVFKGDLTREEATNALSGMKENKVLRLVIGGEFPQKHFVNGEPVSREVFEGITRDELKVGIKRKVNIYFDGKQ